MLQYAYGCIYSYVYIHMSVLPYICVHVCGSGTCGSVDGKPSYMCMHKNQNAAACWGPRVRKLYKQVGSSQNNGRLLVIG